LPWAPGHAALATDLPWTPFVQVWWPGPSFMAWAPLADWTAWGAASFQAWASWLDQAPLLTLAPAGSQGHGLESAYASYRSSGGHAAAQVIAPAADFAGLTVSAVLRPMHTVLGAWRAALEG
jgi:hypothetical protein